MAKRVVQLQDIADVQINEAVEYIKVNANGKEGLLIAVIKQPNSNLVDVSKQMEDKISRTKKNSSERCNYKTILYTGRFRK